MSTKIKRVVTSPKATAAWLLANTSLTFKQIADFCHMHTVEVRSIADGVMSDGIKPKNPILAGELTKEEISESEANPNKSLEIQGYDLDQSFNLKIKSKTYVSLSKRQNKPSAIMWLINNVEGISIKEIRSLTGATKPMIESIMGKTHKSFNEIVPKDPVSLGICTQTQLNEVVSKLQKAQV